MTNRNDFDFDDDPFADNDKNNNFNSFDDLDNDANTGFDSLDDDFGDDLGADPAQENQGSSRRFVLLALLLGVIFVVLILVGLFLLARPQPESPDSPTRTAIANQNATLLAIITLTNAAQTEQFFLDQTQAALPTETPTPSPSPSPTETPTIAATETPSLNETAVEETSQAVLFQQTRDALTQAALPAETQDPGTGGPLQPAQTISISDVQQTATALALILNPPTPSGQQTDQQIPLPGNTGTAVGFSTPRPRTDPTLPDTGLFDGFGSGDGFGTIALMAVGLVGLIVMARTIRRRVDR
ncbi:MAG: hypothetical protein MUF87_00110 [Anaerolineae bacterium]|jgi:hypothetical protein|nr:hypothetical protein [Anaerolineae bacterium]